MVKDDIETLKGTDNKCNSKILQCGNQDHVYAMQAYSRYLRDEEINDITSIVYQEFNDCRIDAYDPNTQPTSSLARTKKRSSLPTTRQSAEELMKGINRDKSHYIALRETK